VGESWGLEVGRVFGVEWCFGVQVSRSDDLVPGRLSSIEHCCGVFLFAGAETTMHGTMSGSRCELLEERLPTYMYSTLARDILHERSAGAD